MTDQQVHGTNDRVTIHVDPWDPAYGAGGIEAAGPVESAAAQVDVSVEVPAADWHPVEVSTDVPEAHVVLLVDGVRRTDASVWITEPDGGTQAGLAVSYAAGIVRCDLRRGAADVVTTAVERGLFTASTRADDLVAGAAVRYQVNQCKRGDRRDLEARAQARMRALEAAVSSRAADPAVCGPTGDGDQLLIVDGPLQHGRSHPPRTIGYAKTHQREYLKDRPAAVVPQLRPGLRSPVFAVGDQWRRYSWYLRLPGPPGAPWSGVVRLECSADLPLQVAVELADRSCRTLPRFASAPYKDPRAPQNLVPIAALERRLRTMLGDPRLLHRALTMAVRRVR